MIGPFSGLPSEGHLLHHRQRTSTHLSSGRKEVYPIMDKEKSLLQQKAEAEKKARQYENQVKILLNKQRDAERHARNHRLIVHGAIMEGVFPFTASMEGEAIKAFLIALSRLPGAAETARKAQETKDEG